MEKKEKNSKMEGKDIMRLICSFCNSPNTNNSE